MRFQFAVQLIVGFCWVFISGDALAKTIRLTSESNWFDVLSGTDLEPGDEVVLEPGVYSDGRRLVIRCRGSEDQPITIRASRKGRVLLRRPDAKQNSINLIGSAYLVVKGLEITGGSSGIRISSGAGLPANQITLENLHIHHIGGVAITANNPNDHYDTLVFRGNHIHHTSGHGEAFYLGANNQADGSVGGSIRNSRIEFNYIHDLKGPQISQGDGIELKDGSYNNRVSNNVIHDTNYPGIIVYGTRKQDRNLIENNVIWNGNDHGIQAAADALIRNNLIFNVSGFGIYCRDHQGASVGNLQITENLIKSPQGLRIIPSRRSTSSVRVLDTITISRNQIHGDIRIPETLSVQNSEYSQADYVADISQRLAQLQLHPLGAQAARAAIERMGRSSAN